MKLNNLLPVIATLVLASACAPREIKPASASDKQTEPANETNRPGTTNPSKGGSTGQEQVANEKGPDGFPIKLTAEQLGQAKNTIDVIDYFLSTGSDEQSARYLFGDRLPMKNEKEDVFGFYELTLQLFPKGTYKLLLTIYDNGGQKVSHGTTDGAWKLEKEKIVIEKGNKAGSLPPTKAKGLIGLDYNNEPSIFLDFSDDIKTTDGMFKVPLEDGWYVFRYTPGKIEPQL